MAAFSTMAAFGLAGFLAGRAAKKPRTDAPLTPGPSSASTIAAPPLPPSTPQQQSTAAAAGIQAAAKTRRRLAPAMPAGTPRMQPVASLQTKSLVGYALLLCAVLWS
jgi:hypothetical protein